MAEDEQIDMEAKDEGYGGLPKKSDKKILEESKVVEHVPSENAVDLKGHVEPPMDDTELNEGFFDILEQAGITKSAFIWFFIILIVVLSVAAFALFSVFSSDEDSGDLSVVDSIVDSAAEVSEEFDFFTASYLLGREFLFYAQPEAGFLGIQSAYNVGVILDPFKSDFVSYVDLLRDMQNIYNVDIYALMDLSVNRSEALEVHLQEIYDLLLKAELFSAEINEELERLDLKFSTFAEESALYEESFFLSLDSMIGGESYDNLNLFIDAEKNVVELRALYNSYNLISQRIVNSSQFLSPRYEDILLNRQALLEGIRVFDLPDSDIDAIVPIN